MDLGNRVSEAVKFFWASRTGQLSDQEARGKRDQGNRGAVTGGAHMDGFLNLLGSVLTEAGVPSRYLYFAKQPRALPGFFRPVKEWDLLVVSQSALILAVEVKSQVGSLGNNFNNRAEEAIGNAVDLWTAFRENAFGSVSPWVGYLMLLEDSPGSRSPVKIKEPHFKAFPEFRGSSYAKRYELLCRKLMLERHYSAAALLLSSRVDGLRGAYDQPAPDLTVERFIASMMAHAKGVLASDQPSKPSR